jgi:galactokinase
MGSHTDYNEGFVLTLAIDRDTWIAAAPRDDGRVRVVSANLAGEGTFRVDRVESRRLEGWPLYVQATAALLAREGHALRGCDALVHGSVPIASGLSSSASLEAATAVLFAALGGHSIDRLAMARLCQRAENEIVGMPCGILDPYSALLGEAGCALLLDCRHLTHRPAAIPTGLQPVVCNTRVRRELTGSEYPERRAQCEEGARRLGERIPGVRALRDVTPEQLAAHGSRLPPEVARRCRFVVEENARVLALAEALEADDRAAIGRLFRESFAGARDLFGIAIPAMEAMQEAMQAAPGVVGARQAGAGFGGCMLALVEAPRTREFVEAVARRYRESTGMAPEIHPVRAAAGAGVLDGA